MSQNKLLIHTIAFNRVDLLKQLIESIDIQDYHLLIHITSDDQDIKNYCLSLASQDVAGSNNGKGLPPTTIYTNTENTITVIDIGYNIGVSECWNEALIRAYKYDQYEQVLFVNSDIVFGKGDINKMLEFSKASSTKLITVCGTHGKHQDWKEKHLSHGFACAILPKSIFEEVGYFDENLFPAYNEDCDYFTRVWLNRKLGPIKPGYDKISAKDSPLVECVLTGQTHHHGSSVIYSDSNMMQRNAQTHANNNRYYMGKWGGLNDHEKYMTPFDEEVSFKIEYNVRHNPYEEYWDRNKDKEQYYKQFKKD